MAQIAKTEAEKATNAAKDTTDNLAELGKRTADVTHEATDRAEGVARRGIQVVQRTAGASLEVERAVARRSAEGTAELGQALIDLVNEQTRHNVEAFKALARTVDWNEVAQIQSEFLRVSLERAAQLTRRYFEVTQAVMASAASATKDQARKAA